MALREALNAMGALLRDPDDTSQVFRIVESLGARTPGRLVRRLRSLEAGRKLLRDKPRLITRLKDREQLAALPEGSLGRAYLDFCRAEGITADGLVSASERGYSGDGELGEDEAYLAERMRDAHDLWHVATGYRGDLIGEASLLAFTYAQTWNRGVGFIVGVALIKARETDLRRTIIDGFVRGRRASWLPVQAWEDMLCEPVARVRRDLRLGQPPRYREIRTGATPS